MHNTTIFFLSKILFCSLLIQFYQLVTKLSSWARFMVGTRIGSRVEAVERNFQELQRQGEEDVEHRSLMDSRIRSTENNVQEILCRLGGFDWVAPQHTP